MTMHETVRLNVDPNHEHVHSAQLPRRIPRHIVNRVPTLHRPPTEDAPYPEVLAYWSGWQQRHPDVDLQAVFDAVVAHVCGLLNEILGVQIDPAAIDTRLDLMPTEEPNQ
ncbi:hypothetical protein SEA_PYTHEAS_80 [Gordonia phage Pytheas]|nr:hypothetical protein SEA_JABLANSKI_79 [Gordonia Phage Jablanski]UYL88107.1 hypothetical protein SEA_PYTHEAS_80 [Gordonia phage Pytheas]